MKILRTYIKENIGILSLGAIFLTLNTFATLAIPFQISNIINLGIMKKDIDMLYSTSIKMVIILKKKKVIVKKLLSIKQEKIMKSLFLKKVMIF